MVVRLEQEVFNRKNEIVEFINVCYLYIIIRMRNIAKQRRISCILSYIQKEIIEV